MLWVEQEQIGFPQTLGIRNNDFRRDRRRHDSPLHGSVVVTTLDDVSVRALGQGRLEEWRAAEEIRPRRVERPASVWTLVYDGFDPAQQGLRESLCSLGNGYFVSRGALPEAVADGILRLLADPAERARLGGRAAAWANAHDADHTAAAFGAIYRRLTARSSSTRAASSGDGPRPRR